jgi:hypothetical protein
VIVASPIESRETARRRVPRFLFDHAEGEANDEPEGEAKASRTSGDQSTDTPGSESVFALHSEEPDRDCRHNLTE